MLISLAISHVFISCNDDEGNFEESMDIPGLTVPAKQTVFMYLPWSGSGLYYSLRKNIEAFESAIENNHGTDGNALIVFISQDNQKSNLIRIYYRDGESQRDTLKQYDFSSCDYTEAEGIAEIINDAKAAAPAEKYAMAIGCHGTGWIPVGTNVGTRAAMINIGKIKCNRHAISVQASEMTTLIRLTLPHLPKALGKRGQQWNMYCLTIAICRILKLHMN